MKPLSAATLIALFLSVLKFGDWILTDRQKESVQRFCDDLTLRLDYASIEKVYLAFRELRWQRVIYLIPIAFQVVVTAVNVPVVERLIEGDITRILPNDEPFNASRLAWAGTAVFVLVFTLILAGIAMWMWKPSRRLFTWMLGFASMPRQDVQRVLWLAVVFLAVRLPSDITRIDFITHRPRPPVHTSLKPRLAARASPIEITGPLDFSSPFGDRLIDQRMARLAQPGKTAEDLWRYDSVISAVVGPPIEITLLDIALLVCILAIAFAARWMLWFLRKVMWRIATHAKGAWAAIVVLTTVILSIFDALLKSRQ